MNFKEIIKNVAIGREKKIKRPIKHMSKNQLLRFKTK